MIFDPFSQRRPVTFQHPGNEHDRRIRLSPRPKPTPGASGSPAKGGSSIADQREQDRRVREFIESLGGVERHLAEARGIDLQSLAAPLADPFPRGAERGHDEDDRHEDPDLSTAAGTHNGDPILHGQNTVIDSLEPPTSVSIDELTDAEIAEAHDAFARAIAWVHDHRLLIKKARRLATLITLCRPDLAATLPQCPLRTAELLQVLDDYPPVRLALVFGRVFAWAREAPSLGTLGVRADIIAYVVRPSLLDAATNAQIGQPLNNTRAAVNKLVQEFRDTFSGIRAPAMRGEDTRTRCRNAQLA